ncbi:membrane-bound lytic murein transglycosylase B [Gammaproteobacteria bacterium]
MFITVSRITILVLLLFTIPMAHATQDFDTWLAGLRDEARTQGISDSVLNKAFFGVTPISRVTELDRHQPETTLTFKQYLKNVLPPSRITQARRQYQEHRELLEQIKDRYEVQPRFLVAFWAIESDFGRNQGGFSVIAALTTLAYDGRRSAYFRGELLDALRILQRGDVTPSRMKGSWAGAMGQAQFMPSVFLKYGVDYDGNGRRDIWGSHEDVLASAANYLSGIGWRGNEGWGSEVRLPSTFDAGLIGLEQTKTLSEWGELGIRHTDGRLLKGDLKSSILQPGGVGNRIFVVYPNYHVIRIWNRSNYFATTVGLLADAIVASQLTQERKNKIGHDAKPRPLYPVSIPRD